MTIKITPDLLRASAGIPGAGVGGILGYLMGPKEHKLDSAARGAGIGYMTGTGLGVGANLGLAAAPEDATTAQSAAHGLGGGLLGAMSGYGAGSVMQGEPRWKERQKFREELLAVLREEQKKHRSAYAKPLQALQKSGSELSALSQLAADHPDLAYIPAGGLVGATLAEKKKHPAVNTLKGIARGLTTGAGVAGGGILGKSITNDAALGSLGGGGLGGLLAYMAAQKVLPHEHDDHHDRRREKYGVGPMLTELLQTKALSDRRDYRGKHAKLRSLIEKYPDDFVIDSQQGNIVGLTHTRTGFRVHAPMNVLPAGLRRMDDVNAIAA